MIYTNINDLLTPPEGGTEEQVEKLKWKTDNEGGNIGGTPSILVQKEYYLKLVNSTKINPRINVFYHDVPPLHKPAGKHIHEWGNQFEDPSGSGRWWKKCRRNFAAPE